MNEIADECTDGLLNSSRSARPRYTHAMLLRHCAALAAFLVPSVLPCGAAFARPPTEQPLVEAPSFTDRPAVGLSVSPVFSLLDFCEREFDLVECSNRGFVTGELSARIPIADEWTLGPVLSYGLEPGERGVGTSTSSIPPTMTSTVQTTHLGGLALRAHYHPLQGGFWLGPRVGLLMLRSITERSANGGATTTSSDAHWGAEAGADLGYDWALLDAFALSFSARAALSTIALEETRASGPTLAIAVGGLFGLD